MDRWMDPYLGRYSRYDYCGFNPYRLQHTYHVLIIDR